MVTVKTDCQLRHMSKQRLPIPAVDVERLLEEKDALYKALYELVSTIIIDDEEGLATFLDPIQRAQAALAKARGE